MLENFFLIDAQHRVCGPEATLAISFIKVEPCLVRYRYPNIDKYLTFSSYILSTSRANSHVSIINFLVCGFLHTSVLVFLFIEGQYINNFFIGLKKKLFIYCPSMNKNTTTQLCKNPHTSIFIIET